MYYFPNDEDRRLRTWNFRTRFSCYTEADDGTSQPQTESLGEARAEMCTGEDRPPTLPLVPGTLAGDLSKAAPEASAKYNLFLGQMASHPGFSPTHFLTILVLCD